MPKTPSSRLGCHRETFASLAPRLRQISPEVWAWLMIISLSFKYYSHHQGQPTTFIAGHCRLLPAQHQHLLLRAFRFPRQPAVHAYLDPRTSLHRHKGGTRGLKTDPSPLLFTAETGNGGRMLLIDANRSRSSELLKLVSGQHYERRYSVFFVILIDTYPRTTTAHDTP